EQLEAAAGSPPHDLEKTCGWLSEVVGGPDDAAHVVFVEQTDACAGCVMEARRQTFGCPAQPGVFLYTWMFLPCSHAQEPGVQARGRVNPFTKVVLLALPLIRRRMGEVGVGGEHHDWDAAVFRLSSDGVKRLRRSVGELRDAEIGAVQTERARQAQPSIETGLAGANAGV